MNNKKEIWIKEGYEIFAIFGLNGLKVELLAKKVGKSKSSFYHYFAELEIFIELLLMHHIQQAYVLDNKLKNANNINLDLINILLEHKTDLLFSKQLRINNEHLIFAEASRKAKEITRNSFISVWTKDLNLKLTQKQLEGIFELALENFCIQINLEDYNHDWLSSYFDHIKKIVENFE